MFKRFSKQDFYSVPNILTYLRFLLVPVFIALFLCDYLYISLIVFVFACLTDVIDGFIARKFNLQTDLGKLIDPLADKILKTSTIICFGVKNIIPSWLFALFLILDLFLIISGAIILKQGIIIKSNILGKLGTVFVSVGVILSFFYEYVKGAHVVFLIIGLVVYLFSCVGYSVIYFKRKKLSNKNENGNGKEENQ